MVESNSKDRKDWLAKGSIVQQNILLYNRTGKVW